MSRRLPQRQSEWIDRSQPVAFRFEGATYQGFRGDVLTSALWANDVRVLGRSFKYHRPRGVYSMANHDVNVMVEDGRRTNLRGDVLPIEPGLDVTAVNTVGGVYGDRLRLTGWFSRFLPVGFYYKAFHTPRRLFPFYENLMRAVAGLGSVKTGTEAERSPKDYAFCDLLVVGAGPAGMAAAVAAAESGIRVMLVDEQPHPGGSLSWQWSLDGDATEHMSRLRQRIADLDQIELRCATMVGGVYADHWIALFDRHRLTKLRARAMLVAAGCIEQPAVFANNDLPGVMLGSAAQRLIHLYAVRPFDRCVILAANTDAYRVALDLNSAGATVAAISDLRPGGEPTPIGQRVHEAGIEILKGHTVVEAVAGPGQWSIEAAVLRPLDGQGSPLTTGARRVACDGIAVSVGWAPTANLLAQAGARFGYGQAVEQFVPRHLPAGVFAAGRVNGVFDLTDQMRDGRRAAIEAAAYLGRESEPVPEPPVHRGPPPSHPYPIFPDRRKKNFVDLDEDLHLADFVHAHQEGFDNIELIKRYTTVGMGPSQGKLSNMNAVRILARLNGNSIDQTGTTTSRPFHQPVPLQQLAGRRFTPLQRTAVHGWHARAGAVFMHAGTWLRPEYYRARGRGRDEAIMTEALSVRRKVGLIDVGTLGKIQVTGPDAATFLERVYTGRFALQKVGRVRYCLALDETGVIIDDGISARLGEDRFYATSTSSGAAAFYRELQRWALIWGMDVTLANLTGHLAAMNIAGPDCRQVLATMTDIDLSAEAFGYLGVREGLVAGAPAIVMRVGFVGELGYEIHVPASCGTHVWSALMVSGRTADIRPVGIEAQRLLRLEKGHVIVGQDTDALTMPSEADMAWALGRDKPFYVGQRALRIASQRPLTRRLVGITVDPDHRGPLPVECHLMFEDGQIMGRVTSFAGRSTLGHPLGMAYVRPDRAKEGTNVAIRVEGGKTVQAKVTSLPFYDSQNAKQKG